MILWIDDYSRDATKNDVYTEVKNGQLFDLRSILNCMGNEIKSDLDKHNKIVQ